MRRLLIVFALLSVATTAAAKSKGLDHWFDQDLIPYVTDQLLTHPRFKGETVVFVVVDDAEPAAVSSELALSLRDRLLDATLAASGVRVGWQQSGTTNLPTAPVDCTHDDIHYYIGLELKRSIDDSVELKVSALDVEQRSWVGGFGKTWRGRLNRSQWRAFQQESDDDTFLGSRDVPFTLAQTDLLARHLAHELSCELLRQTNGAYVVPAATAADDSGELDGTVELISNNIATHSAFEITTDDQRANAELSAKAHQIDGALYQYWLSVTPNGKDEELTALSVSAYVVLPNTRLASNEPERSLSQPGQDRHHARLAPIRPQVVSIPNAGADGLLGPLRITTPTNAAECRSRHGLTQTVAYWTPDDRCSLLEAATLSDSVVFFLEHQPHLGLVRLGADDCRDRTTARVVRRGDPLKFPVAWFRQRDGETRETTEWAVNPNVDTYYAIAISDARLARRLANHIDLLPIRCGEASRPGFTGSALVDWLDEFAALAARSAGRQDWRALQLKDVY